MTSKVPPRRSMIPISGQPIELPGDGLAVSAHPACDLDMSRRRHDAGALSFLGAEARQPQQFGLDAVVDGQRAELINPRRERADGLHQTRQQGMGEPRLGLEHLAECGACHGGDQAIGARLDACRAGAAVDRGKLAENLAGSQFAEAHGLADRGIDGDPDLPKRQEEHVVRSVEIVENWLSRSVALPGAAPLDPLDRLRREAGEDGDPLQRTARFLGLRLRHLIPLRLVRKWRTINQALEACIPKKARKRGISRGLPRHDKRRTVEMAARRKGGQLAQNCRFARVFGM